LSFLLEAYMAGVNLFFFSLPHMSLIETNYVALQKSCDMLCIKILLNSCFGDSATAAYLLLISLSSLPLLEKVLTWCPIILLPFFSGQFFYHFDYFIDLTSLLSMQKIVKIKIMFYLDGVGIDSHGTMNFGTFFSHVCCLNIYDQLRNHISSLQSYTFNMHVE
ncbi:hypothetical protein ACJX0J_020161, partial [Zea mays]